MIVLRKGPLGKPDVIRKRMVYRKIPLQLHSLRTPGVGFHYGKGQLRRKTIKKLILFSVFFCKLDFSPVVPMRP